MQELLKIIDELNDFYIGVWKDVCNIESPTNYKEGVDAVGNFFIKMANERKWLVEVFEHKKAGNAICITINHQSKAQPVVFSGHIDTVHPIGLFGTPAVRCDETKIYGPGVEDCKGGVVASFMALDALCKRGFTARPVKLIIQSDEETGSRTSNKETIEFMCKKAEGAIAFLNTEGSRENTAVLTTKGILYYKFTISGKAAHSANCVEGANAIAEAAHKILKLETLKDTDTLTCNCGIIEGGTVANAVAEKCSFTADFRFSCEQDCNRARKIAEDISAETFVEGCECRLEQIGYRPAMPPCDRNSELLEKINEIYTQNGLPYLTSRTFLGGTDGAYITAAGIPCIEGLGVEGGMIHSAREFAYLKSLATSAKRLAAAAMFI